MAGVIRGSEGLEIPAEEVEVGDLVVVRPGERIPVDGVVTEGHSAVGESVVIGESIPMEKEARDRSAGTVTPWPRLSGWGQGLSFR